MEGVDISIILRTDSVASKSYKGVFSLDEHWPSPVPLPACYVINSGTKTGPGEHWLAFYIDSDRSCDYFDSMGTAPIKPIYKWLNAHCTVVHYNKNWLQSPTSDACGAYAVYFLLKRSRGASLGDVVNKFEPYKFEYNDALVVQLVRNIYE